MTFDGHTGTLDSSSAEFQSLNYDLEQFHAMLDQDPSLTQGLDTLGNCNSDTSCVDQRCLSHLPNSDLGYGSPFQPSFENGNPMSALQTPNLHAANFDGINLHNMNFQQSNSLGQGLRNANTLQQNHHQPQFWMHTDNISHSMTNRFPGYSMFFPEDGCANSCFTPTPFGTHQNNSHHLQSTYGDCFSADCNSQCNIPCESQCGEDVTVCCYEADCHETAQSICCFGDFCDGSQICVDEPCNDEACKAASNPCTDANCMGSGTVSTTPVSPSIRTPPSLEADHMIQTITSPSDLTANTDALFKIPSTLLYKHRSESIATEHQSIQASLKSRSTSVASTPMEGILGPGREKQVIGYDNQFMCRWTLANGDVCGQILDSNENLQTHCKNEHLGDLAKTETGYSCGWHGCRRVTNFTQKSKLERHMQTHTGCKLSSCAFPSKHTYIFSQTGEVSHLRNVSFGETVAGSTLANTLWREAVEMHF